MPGLHPHRACPEKMGREERPGREAGLAPPGWLQQRTLVPGITPPVTLLPPGEGIQVSRQQEARVCCSLARGCFPLDTIQGPQVAQSQALGQKPRMSVCWAHQRGRASGPDAGPRAGRSSWQLRHLDPGPQPLGKGVRKQAGATVPGARGVQGCFYCVPAARGQPVLTPPGEQPRRCDTGLLNVASTTVPRSFSLGHRGSLAAGTKPGSLCSFSSTST